MSRPAAAAALVALLVLVSGASVRALGASAQAVSAKVYVDPLSASIGSSRMFLKTGQDGKVTASVTNRGSAAVVSVRLVLVTPPGVAVTPGALSITTLTGGATRTSSWIICTSSAGTYLVIARAMALDRAGRNLLAESKTAVIAVEGRPKACH